MKTDITLIIKLNRKFLQHLSHTIILMNPNYQITPWQTYKDDDEDYSKAASLKYINKSHRRSMILPPILPLSANNPSKHIEHNYSDNKQHFVSLRSKRLSVADAAHKRVSGQDVLVIPPIQYSSAQYNIVPRVYKQIQHKIKVIQGRRSEEQLQQILQPNQDQQYTLPLKMTDVKSAKKLSNNYKSKSLSSLHNHIKYYKEKQKHKQNNKIQPIKFDSLQQIIRRLPKREYKSIEKTQKSLTPHPAQQSIKLLEPFPKIVFTQKKQVRKARAEHYLDKLFQKMS